jgi:hypothetical protein
MDTGRPTERVVQLVGKIEVARNREFKNAGIHPQYVGEARSAGLIERVGRGMYVLPGRRQTPQQRFIEACKRVPQGVLCLLGNPVEDERDSGLKPNTIPL